MKYLTAILLVLISAVAMAQDNIADCDRLMMDSINQVAQLEKADTDSFNKIFLEVHDASLRLHACSFLVLELPGESTLKPIISFDLPDDKRAYVDLSGRSADKRVLAGLSYANESRWMLYKASLLYEKRLTQAMKDYAQAMQSYEANLNLQVHQAAPTVIIQPPPAAPQIVMPDLHCTSFRAGDTITTNCQ
jgi:hypothetical protein